jgi:hypothetical protein
MGSTEWAVLFNGIKLVWVLKDEYIWLLGNYNIDCFFLISILSIMLDMMRC